MLQIEIFNDVYVYVAYNVVMSYNDDPIIR